MKIIFGQPWGGLGDNLQFTTLPKLFSERGYEFYVSKHNAYRNSEIYKFCWENNPYVKGIVDDAPNIGACAPDIPRGTSDNVVSAAEIRHGFSGKGRYPEIYYSPTFLEEFKDKVIVDLSAHTLLYKGINEIYNGESLLNKIKENVPDDALCVTFSNLDTLSIYEEFPFKDNRLVVQNIFQYADIIHSVRKYFCLYSGGNSMSSGIKYKFNSNVDLQCFLPGTVQEHKDKAFFVFDNVHYIES